VKKFRKEDRKKEEEKSFVNMTTMTTNNNNDDDKTPRASSPTSSDSDSERELGRHDYWESTYERELATLEETGDEGEVWFGGKVEEAVAGFCAALLLLPKSESDPPSSPPPPPPLAPRLLDVGCGNGALLLALAKRGFTDLTGSDYSERALELARAVVERRKEKEETEKKGETNFLARASFSFVHDDATRSTIPAASFDAATDKGTLDAVGLSAGGVAARKNYLLGVAKCLKKKTGLLIVTSVNSTLEELRAEVEALEEEAGDDEGGKGGKDEETETEAETKSSSGDHEAKKTEEEEKKKNKSSSSSRRLFDYLDHVRTYPVYSFGGRTGARVATVAFRKR
jgi:EEF1A lysine methyltransferase 2